MDEKTNQPHEPGGCFCMGVGPQVTSMADNLWSRATNDHFRNSRVEFLKGLRSLLDDRIDKMSRSGPAKGTQVPVE